MKPRRDPAAENPAGAGAGEWIRRANSRKDRQPPRVLRWLPGGVGPSLRSALRPDAGDLLMLAHPALATPVSFARDPRSGRRYAVRAYVEGLDIVAALRPRASGDLIPWLASAAEPLAVLHRAGFPHGGVKASNLIVPNSALFSRARRGPRVVLCDPRLAVGSEPAGAFTEDLQALGAVFFQLLTGQAVPPEAGALPPSPSDLNPEVPVDLGRIVTRLLAPDPSRNYRDASALLEDLRRLKGPPAARPAVPECFVDRKTELAHAASRLGDPGRPAAIAIAAEGGGGKTAFLRRLAREAELMGYRTVLVRCYPGSARPLEAIRLAASELILPGSRGRQLRRRCLDLLGRDDRRDGSPGHRGEEEAHDASARRVFLKALRDLLVGAAADDPALLLVDDVHFADPLTMELVAGLAGEAASDAPEGALSLVLSFRGEDIFREPLKPVLDAFRLRGERMVRIDLGPLGNDAVEEWLRVALADDPEARERLGGEATSRGQPLVVREAIRIAAREGRGLPEEGPRERRALGGLETRILKALAALSRPAPEGLLAAALGVPEAQARAALDRLVRDGTLAQEGGYFFRCASLHLSVREGGQPAETRTIHRRLAGALEAREPAAVREIAHHWLESDEPRRGVVAAIEAARSLRRTHEDRSAVRFYLAAIDLLPAGGKRVRAIAEEAAEACLGAAEYRRGAQIIGGLLEKTRAREESGRLHARRGVHFHRAGDIAAAEKHLRESLRLLAGGRSLSGLRERLWAESELAEIAVNRGGYQEAETICRRALGDLAAAPGSKRDRGVQRVEMVLLGTLAHLQLRRFEFAPALELFEESLAAGAKLGAVAERSLILNNLGTLHVQENRFLEAIKCYERAREISRKLQDDQSLAVLESNLAVLLARTGDPAAANGALRLAARHEARCDSARIRFLRLHSAGMTCLSLGRYEEGAATLEAAVSLGGELGDAHMTAFDLVHLGECHLLRGDARAATAALARALELPGAPRPIATMVAARRAALAALRRDARAFKGALVAYEASPRHGIEYVNAWNRVFLGWGLRLMGREEEARAHLETAVGFFASAVVPAGELHASLELSQAEAACGRVKDARRRLETLRRRFRPGEGPLTNPMLAARTLLCQARLDLEQEPPLFEEACARLLEAEGFLVGRALRDLEAMSHQVRSRIRALAGRDPGRDPGRSPAERRPPEGRGAAPAGSSTAEILGQSPSIRGVITLVRRLAGAALPVLISGETGTGKELVARALHGESPRFSAPFLCVNCAALPPDLLEAELFGHTRGSFTGAVESAGLLAAAGGGTVLFDEVGEMPIELQSKLLRVLDRGRVRPVGGTEEIETDARFLFATNRDLSALAADGKFRKDLLFRLGAFEIRVPPLRERIEDIPILVERFRAEALGGSGSAAFSEDAFQALAAHPWPGNVRELRNVVFRLVLTRTGRIGAEDVKLYVGKPASGRLFSPDLLRSHPPGELLFQLEREHLILLHADHGGDLEAMAKALGITVRALYDRFRRLKVRPSEL